MRRAGSLIFFTLLICLMAPLVLMPRIAFALEGDAASTAAVDPAAENSSADEDASATSDENNADERNGVAANVTDANPAGALINGETPDARQAANAGVQDAPIVEGQADETADGQEAEPSQACAESSAKPASAETKADGSTQEGAMTAQEETCPAATMKVNAHVQDKGWMGDKAIAEGGTLIGTTGQALRLEALKITVSGPEGTVQCQTHVQNVGWQDTVAAGGTAGTTGRSLRVEAVRLALTGELSRWYDISYRAHIQDKGWLSWVTDGGIAGTSGQALRLEALEIKLVPKASKAAEAGDGIVGVRTSAHVQDVGWQNQVNTGEVAGTTGRGLRLESLKLVLDAGSLGGGVQARGRVQNVGWQDYQNGTTGTTGKGLRLEAVQLKLTGAIAEVYDIVYRAHMQNIGWQPWTVDGGIAGIESGGLRIEAIQIKLVKKSSGQAISEGAYLIAASGNAQEVLNVTGDSESANTKMQVNSYNTSSFSERFYIRKSDGAITVQAAVSGLFLTDTGDSTVVQAAQNNADSQRWTFSWNAGYQLKNVATGKVMALASTAANGVWVNTAAADEKTALQRWTLADISIIPDGTYTFTNTNSGHVLDVAGANRRDDANVQIHESNGGNNQKFTVTYLGSGQYSIRNLVTTRAVQISGTNVLMHSWSGATTQKWKVDLVGAKTFRFVNVSADKSLDVVNGSKTSGSNVVVTGGIANSQHFKLAATSRVAETVEIGVPVIFQEPELPTGCESVALTEALNYYGFNLAKTIIADNYMPWSGDDFVYSFMGNPHSYYGAAIMAPGITNTANSFLASRGSSLRATNITGTAYSDLYTYLDQGIPVVVWNTMYMNNPGAVQAEQDGYYMRSWTHAVTLSGYNPFNNTVLVADPLDGGVWRDRGRFEWLYNEMGRQAVIIR